MDDDHEFALEAALNNIEDNNDQSEDELDDLSVISDFSERLVEEGAETQSNGGNSYRSLPTHHGAPTIPSISLKSILEDERSFMLFRRFVKDGCISRNLQFWLACEHFRSQLLDKAKLMESASAIYKKFLGSSAPLHISVMDATKKKIQITIQLKTGLDSNLFMQAQQEIYHQMECNEVRQFLLSDSFSDCSMFNDETSLAYVGLESFQPARYRGGSLHSGSDDSTSVTSFNSDSMSGTVLCAPRHTRPHLLQSPRNAHSDTEHYSTNSTSANTRHNGGIRGNGNGMSTQHTTFFSRGKSLSAREFYELLYSRLTAVDKDRANLQKVARNIAREQGKSYEEIMSLDWYDAPTAIKYVEFEDTPATGARMSGLKLNDMQSSPLLSQDQQQQHVPNGGAGVTSHITSMAAKEIQEALKDMEISRQVRQKRTASVVSASSASSYISDSGLGESCIPSSRGTGGQKPYVHAYLKNQHRVTSQLSDREHQAHLAATMLINNSTHHEDLNPRSNQYHNYGPYSSDDSSSCFTTTSQSSSSEFFIPRRTQNNMYSDSDSTRQSSRYPPGMKRMSHHKRSSHASSTQQQQQQQQPPRYYPQASPHPVAPPHSQNSSLVPPSQQQPPQSYSTRDVSSSNGSMHSPVAQSKSNPSDHILVAYTMEGYSNTMAKRLPSAQLSTLGDFKEKVFQRRGMFRFFFKTFCEDLNQEIMEELSDDCSPLPRFEGKIIGQVEKVETNL